MVAVAVAITESGTVHTGQEGIRDNKVTKGEEGEVEVKVKRER